MIEIAGKLIIELAELDALTRAGDSAIKAFLTRRFDDYRPPYGKHTVDLPRQCIFAGSINPPVGGYLETRPALAAFGRSPASADRSRQHQARLRPALGRSCYALQGRRTVVVGDART